MCLFVSCKTGHEYNNEKGETYDLDSIFYSWDQKTISLIEKVHPINSSMEYYRGLDLPIYKEDEYIREEVIKNRQSLMRAVLPILLGMTDSILVEELYDVSRQRIDIYGNGKVYKYQFDTKTHLPSRLTIKPINVSEEIRWVEKGFYWCYEQGFIHDVSCITLITQPDGLPQIEILALTVNAIVAID